MKPTQTEIERLLLAYHPNECVLLKYDTSTIYSPHEALEIYYHFPKEIGLIDFIEYIELRSIDSLTEKEAVKCMFGQLKDIYKFNGKPLEALNYYKTSDLSSLFTPEVDYLRSIRIAVPFAGYTIEQLLESGILKIKE